MTKKIGLALGGGGARGFCHIGVIEVLQEHGITVDVVTGCSMGAMIGAGLASGVTTTQMRELAARAKSHRVFDVDPIGIWWKGGVARGNSAMKMARNLVGERNIEDLPIKFACIAADLKKSDGDNLHVFRDGQLWDAVRASIAIPGVFHPVVHDGKLLVDGAVVKRMPIAEARELGADIIIAVDPMGPPQPPTKNSVLSKVEAALMAMDWRVARHEGKDADILIMPQMPGRSAFWFKNNMDAVEAGREAALKALPQILALVNG